MAERVAITGTGLLCPSATGVSAFEAALRQGQRAFTRRTDILAPRGKDLFGMTQWPEEPHRSASMGAAVLAEALVQSRTELGDGRDVGLLVGTVWGDTIAAEDLYGELKVCRSPSPAQLEALLLYPTGRLANSIGNAVGAYGPRLVISNACASGNIALGIGLDLIRSGRCRVVFVVGVDRFSLTGLWGAERSGFVGRELRPFDLHRDGTVLGEGAAAIVLERESDSSQARALAWLDGYACVCEEGAAAITLRQDGRGLRDSMRGAVADAGRTLAEIAYVNAHAPGTPMIDRIECEAISALWEGTSCMPLLNSTKSITGHLSGASAVIEVIATVIQLRGGFVHPNVGLTTVDPQLPLPVIGPVAVEHEIRCALSNACGGGGMNTSVVVSAADCAPSPRTTPEKVQVVLTGYAGLQAPSGLRAGDWFDVSEWLTLESQFRNLNRSAQLAATAGAQAIGRAGLRAAESYPGTEVAVVGGTWLGGWTTGSAALCDGLSYRPVRILPSTALDNGCHLGAVIICRHYRFTGPSYTICGSTTGGLQALAVAHQLLVQGRAAAAVVMGYETWDPWLERAADWLPECPALRNFVEGAAAVVLERADRAERRSAPIFAEVIGAACAALPLTRQDQVDAAAEFLCAALPGNPPDMILATGPSDPALLALARALGARMGARVRPPPSGHSVSADGLLALQSLPREAELVLVVAAESEGSQVAILLAPVQRSADQDWRPA